MYDAKNVESHPFVIACIYGKFEIVKKFYDKYGDKLPLDMIKDIPKLIQLGVVTESHKYTLQLLILNNDRLTDEEKSQILCGRREGGVLLKVGKRFILQCLEYFTDENKGDIFEYGLMQLSFREEMSIIINDPDLYNVILKSSLSFDVKYRWILHLLDNKFLKFCNKDGKYESDMKYSVSNVFIENVLQFFYKSKSELVPILTNWNSKLLVHMVFNEKYQYGDNINKY